MCKLETITRQSLELNLAAVNAAQITITVVCRQKRLLSNSLSDKFSYQ